MYFFQEDFDGFQKCSHLFLFIVGMPYVRLLLLSYTNVFVTLEINIFYCEIAKYCDCKTGKLKS